MPAWVPSSLNSLPGFTELLPHLKVQQIPYLLQWGQDLGSVLTGASMKVPELGLLQTANSGPQLSKASSISKGPVVAACGLLTVML